MRTFTTALLTCSAAIMLTASPALADAGNLPAYVRLPANVRMIGATPTLPPRTNVSPTIVAPQITSGTVVTTTQRVGVPSSVTKIEFAYTTGSAGLNFASFTFTSPNGQVSNTLTYYAGPQKTSGRITFIGNGSAPFYSEPGTWTLTQISIGDFQYNITNYDQAQIAQIFKNSAYTLINDGPVDTTPPVVLTGQVQTPTVSLSAPYPQFVARMTGTDNLSGLSIAYVYIQPPGAPYSLTTTSFFKAPLLHGAVDATVPIFAGSATGTYTISGYEMCDVAGNCFIDTSSADVQKLFGTTSFTVTS